MRRHGAGRLGRADAASPRRGVAVVMVVACLACHHRKPNHKFGITGNAMPKMAVDRQQISPG